MRTPDFQENDSGKTTHIERPNFKSEIVLTSNQLCLALQTIKNLWIEVIRLVM